MDKLIKEDDEFILLKLTTGETLEATIRAEDEQTISVEYPFELKTIHDRRQDMVVDVTLKVCVCCLSYLSFLCCLHRNFYLF